MTDSNNVELAGGLPAHLVNTISQGGTDLVWTLSRTGMVTSNSICLFPLNQREPSTKLEYIPGVGLFPVTEFSPTQTILVAAS